MQSDPVPFEADSWRVDANERKQAYWKRLLALETERNNGWRDHWRDVADHVHPRNARFLVNDAVTAGAKKHGKIINSTATRASRVQASGMMAGISSPARPWFRLTTADPGLDEMGSVRSWLHTVEERIRQVFQRSNVYQVLHSCYSSLGDFGTAAAYIDEDQDTTLRGYFFPIGSYALALDGTLRVNSMYRRTTMTVGAVVKRFGFDNCSSSVRSLFEQKSLEHRVELVHLVEPNDIYVPDKLGVAGMRWRSVWFEAGDASTGLLSEGGYHENPVIAPRWEVCGEDAYGSSPGMDALGDIRALQSLEKRKAEMVEKIVRPPMRGPSNITRASLLPGDFTPYDGSAGKFEPAMEINPNSIPALAGEIREHETRINAAFFADLWLMLAQSDSPQMTAREVAERHEEKMLQLGPVMERLEQELHSPLIERTFGILLRSGQLPPPPEEIQGSDIRVDFISIMAQAQRMLGIGAVDRLVQSTFSMAAVKPEVLDKLDLDKVVDEYGLSLGVKPDLIRSDEDVQAIRAQRGQAQAQQMAQQQAMQQAQTASTLANTPMGQDTALDRLVASISPMAGAGR